MRIIDNILQKMVEISQTEVSEPSHLCLDKPTLDILLNEYDELGQLNGESPSQPSIRDLEDFFGARLTLTDKGLSKGWKLLSEI